MFLAEQKIVELLSAQLFTWIKGTRHVHDTQT